MELQPRVLCESGVAARMKDSGKDPDRVSMPRRAAGKLLDVCTVPWAREPAGKTHPSPQRHFRQGDDSVFSKKGHAPTCYPQIARNKVDRPVTHVEGQAGV